MMWAKISCSTHSCFWALPSCAYWTGISVIPENWLSSAGTGVEPTDMRQLRATAYLCSETEIQLLLVAVLNWRDARLESKAVMKSKPESPNLSDWSLTSPWKCVPTCKCFMSQFAFFSLSVGVCEYSYILMNPILLFCSTFIFIPAFSPETPADTPLDLHLCRLSVCAVKGQTETRAHCELIPVKCLLCLCNGFQPAAPHYERMGMCATWSHKRKSAWKFHIQRKVEAHQ